MTYTEYAKEILASLAAEADRKQSLAIGCLSRLVEITCNQIDKTYKVQTDRAVMRIAFIDLLPNYPTLSFTDGN